MDRSKERDNSKPESPAPTPPTPPPPTPISRKFVTYVIGFGVSVAVGLAPYLGKVHVPLFEPLLNLIPETIQNTVLPLSSALMGIVAVLVQWYAFGHLSDHWFKKMFGRVLITGMALFIFLVVAHTFFVVRVPYLGGQSVAYFLVGAFERPTVEPCTRDVSDAECIKRLTFDTSEIESFWGDRSMRFARLGLMLPYCGFTSCFAMLVGLLVLRQRTHSQG